MSDDFEDFFATLFENEHGNSARTTKPYDIVDFDSTVKAPEAPKAPNIISCTVEAPEAPEVPDVSVSSV